MTDAPSQMPELKPCPFCGGCPDKYEASGTWVIECPCPVGPHIALPSYSEKNTVEEWNTRAASVPILDYPLDKKGWKEGADITEEWAYLRDECMKYYDMAEDKLNACVGHKEDGYGIARQLQGFLGYCVMHLNAHGVKQQPSDKEQALQAVHNLCSMANGYWRAQDMGEGDKEMALKDVQFQADTILPFLTAPDQSETIKALKEALDKSNIAFMAARADVKTASKLINSGHIDRAAMDEVDNRLGYLIDQNNQALALAEKASVA